MASIPTNGYAEVMAGTNNYSGSNSFDGSCPRTAIPPVIGDDLTNKTYVDNATGGGIIGTLTDKGSLLTGDGTQPVIFDQNPYQTALATTTVYNWNALAIGQSRQFTTTFPTLIPLGAEITITYSGTDSIKGTITSVAGSTITITIINLASLSYSSTFLLQTSGPAGSGGNYTDGTFPFNPAVTTPNPPNIPANTIITDGQGYIYTSVPAGVPVSITPTIIGSNIERPTATPFNTIPWENPTVTPTNFNFPSGCFVGTTQSPSVQFVSAGQPYRVGFPSGGTFVPPNYVGSLSGYTVGYSIGTIVIDDDIALIADPLSSTGLAWGVINTASIGAVTSVSGGVNIVMSGTIPAPVVNLRNPLTAELNMGSQSLRDSASAVGTSGQLLSAGTGGQTLWTNPPPTNPTITDTNTNATYYPTFVAGSGTQPLLADISTGPISLNPSNGNFNVVDTLKLTQTQVAVGKSAGLTSQGASSVAIGSGAGQITQGAQAVAIGVNSAVTGQGTNSVAIGVDAGNTNQSANAVAVGIGAGQTTQGLRSVAVGRNAGNNTQSFDSVAVGNGAGQTTQGNSSVAVGLTAGQTNQGIGSVAVGGSAGQTTQGASCVAVGLASGTTNQGASAVAIGVNAGNSTQGGSAIAIGSGAGQSTQGSNCVALGQLAGNQTARANCIAIGLSAGQFNQGQAGASSVAVGESAGNFNQGALAVAIGSRAGASSQGADAVAISYNAGETSQGTRAVAIGYTAGQTTQGANAVAVGHNAGQTSQGLRCISIGFNAGNNTQSNDAVAIGHTAGQTTQGTNSVAVGNNSGNNNQGASAVAIGNNAGQGTTSGQGANAIAIGHNAGVASQTAGSICLNATGSALNPNQAGFFVAPIRNLSTISPYNLQYNSTTDEVVSFLNNNNIIMEDFGMFDTTTNFYGNTLSFAESGNGATTYYQGVYEAGILAGSQYRKGVIQMASGTANPSSTILLTDLLFSYANISKVTFGIVPHTQEPLSISPVPAGNTTYAVGIASAGASLGNQATNTVIWRMTSSGAAIPAWTFVINNVVQYTLTITPTNMTAKWCRAEINVNYGGGGNCDCFWDLV